MNKLIYTLAFVVMAASCKKKDVLAPVGTTTPVSPPVLEVSYNDLLKDSALFHAKDLYLWYKNIPATMNARQYADPSAIMTAIRPYSHEPGFSQPVDRWSFAIEQSEWNNNSTGNENDLGFSVLFNTASDLRVKYVEKESAAGRAGIQRGWRVLAINGNTNIDTSASSIQMIISSVFNSSSGNFKFRKTDGSVIDINLTGIAYNEKPVFVDKVYALSDGTKVGYMGFNSFMGDTTDTYNEFNRVFTKFSQNNITELVIDLRYNGGGYVTVAEKLANYLAPAYANGQTMMVESFNDKYSRYNETKKFRKVGNVNVNRIIFIVSNGTASASELVINSVKPFVDVKLIGPSTATHGKPVGFFPIPVGNWYVFPVSFKTVNKNGEGNYYNGFPVNQRVRDGVDVDWGATNEACLQAALNYIQSGSLQGRTTDEPIRTIQKNDLLNNQFKGTIDTRGIR
jgi:carboxyl-terminal processing protease